MQEVRNITILYGTESGNAEMAAEDFQAAVAVYQSQARAISMSDFDVAYLADAELIVIITSTYGEGEMPETALPFYEKLLELSPDLSGTRFLAFGLGDSTYATYNQAIDQFATTLTKLGAQQIGETGRHDAARGQSVTDVITAWAASSLPQFSACEVSHA